MVEHVRGPGFDLSTKKEMTKKKVLVINFKYTSQWNINPSAIRNN
jgi:hypothetical protein